MAGVTDFVFRQLCKEQGADVLTTEFVSADGILHRNERTQEYIAFDPALERPWACSFSAANPSGWPKPRGRSSTGCNRISST